jgi:hypothetical protein
MKKLLVLAAFIIMGSMAFAQAPSKAKTSPAATTNTATATVVAPEAAIEEVAAVKKETKKECSDADKKECGSSKTSGKKSCCSHKAEATKEETK